MRSRFPLILILLAGAQLAPPLSADEAVPDFSAVFRIFDERCLECHAADDETEGGLVLESHGTLMKGGESGAAIEPGKSAESLLIKYLRGEVQKDGKKKFMPPGKREKLSPEEIQLIAKWIDAGARPPLAGPDKPREINVPKIAPKTPPRNAVYALAFSAAAKLIAVGRYGVVEMLDAETRMPARKLEGHKGNVNALVFSQDGKHLFAASGENGLFGEVKQWNVADGQLLRTIHGHRDTLYALALSPDGKTVATGGYDQQIKLWSSETGAELKTLRGHNGAVYAVAFRPDGRLLASASADRTVKLWDVATGQRRDTLSQPTKEQVTLAWAADGKRLAAAGFDNRIRVWEVSADARETTNPLLIARFAHEQPILRIAWSADGRRIASSAQDATVKLWDAAEVKERVLLEKQPDWPSALVFLDTDTIVTGRLDGTLAFYDAATGDEASALRAKKAAGPVQPVVSAVQPRGIQRGVEARVKLLGTNLQGLTAVKSTDTRLSAEVAPGGSANEAWVTFHTPADPLFPRGSYEFTVTNDAGQTSRPSKIVVDDLPQLDATEKSGARIETFPVSIWGAIEKAGVSDRFEFDAKAGQTLVFDLAAKSIGSKMDAVLSLTDAAGHVLASNNDFDSSGDPLVAHAFKADGRYAIVVSDLQFGGSTEHFYRLSAGQLPFVTASFPLSIRANEETEVKLIGFNLPPEPGTKVQARAAGELPLAIDAAFRSRRGFTVLVSDLPETIEREPNDSPDQATALVVPGSGAGRFIAHAQNASPSVGAVANGPEQSAGVNQLDQRRVAQVPEISPRAPILPGASPATVTSGADFDYYKFEATKDSTWVIETQAAQRGSPADTRIDLFHPDGKPVERLLLQAVRDSAITFRGIDSATNDARVDNWREMELNELLFINGEVAKIFRMPEGPDSGFQFYTVNGKRRSYFNTTATAHPLDEPCYIIQPHPPGTKLISNGLPVFPLYYANDDDGERQLGTDSRLLFTAPADGAYLVRVSDSRGITGDRYVYRLVVREAKPDFSIRAAMASQTVNIGSGQSFTVTADRKDGFDGDIHVEISGLPEGFIVATPLVIEGGHQLANGSLFAVTTAKQPADSAWSNVKMRATAVIKGEKVIRTGGSLGNIKLGEAPKVYVGLEPAAPGDTLEHLSKPTPLQDQDPAKPLEMTIAPGEIIPAWIKVKRNGHASELRFDVENLPHGVIIDNLGLNGITLLDQQNEGEIALKAEASVRETDRLCYAVTREVGKQTSLPVLLHVRKKEAVKSVQVK